MTMLGRAPQGQPSQLVDPLDDDARRLALDPEWVLPRRINYWAERNPDRIFLQEVTGRSCTYGECIEGIRRWATVLRSWGVQPGDRILTMIPASIDAYHIWMAASCIGACEVPLNPELKGEFLKHASRASESRVALVRPEFESIIQDADVDGLSVISIPRDKSPADSARPGSITWPAPEDECCIIYTSGTTGPAKGAIQSWAQMTATIGRIPRGWFSEKDAAYCCHAIFHVTGRSPLPAMSDAGGKVVLRERFSLREFWNDIRKFDCTTTTAFIPMLLGLPELDDDLDNPLRVVFAACPPGLQTVRFTERFGVHTVNAYGSTELGFPLVMRWPKPLPETGAAPRDCGWLRRGYQARVVDAEGVEVPDGTSGELWVKPPARSLMMIGYNGLPDRTEKAIVDGWYHTGDRLIRHPNGNFEFIDRMGDTIRRMGENISSSALEAVIVTDLDIQDCAAIGVPDDVAGQEILLLIIPADGAVIEPDRFFRRLQNDLPEYMLPAFIMIADDADISRTPTNKIRKSVVRDSFDPKSVWQSPRFKRRISRKS